MLKSLSLHNFKNHVGSFYDFGFSNIIVGPNGSGKTNILEAIYYILNGNTYKSFKSDTILNYFGDSFFVLSMISDDIMDKELKITYDKNTAKLSIFYNNSKVTRPKYIASTGKIAIFFSPLEMNVIYLGPSLRRDFLDEVSLLDNPAFAKVKNDYAKILKNRNRLLKDIKEGNASKNDLNFWNDSFIKVASEYYSYRIKFIDFIRENMKEVEGLLENKYELKLEYETKVDFGDVSSSIKNYLEKNAERDIITGHTYIGPHLDDFLFYVKAGKTYHLASEFLSRGENKSILISLKLLEIEYFKKTRKEEIILLLDDIFAELDDKHISLVLSYANKYQTFITAQNLPNSVLINENMNVINT